MGSRSERIAIYRQHLLSAERRAMRDTDGETKDLQEVLAAASAEGDDDYRLLAEAELRLVGDRKERSKATLPLFERAALTAEQRDGEADAWLLRRWGQALALSGDDLGARDRYEAALASDPQDHLTMGLLAGLLDRQGDPEQAEDMLAAAFAANPNDYWLYMVTAPRLFGAKDDADRIDFERVRAATLRHPSVLRRYFLYAAQQVGLAPAAEWEAMTAQLPREVDRRALLGDHGWASLVPLSGTLAFLLSRPMASQRAGQCKLWYELEGDEDDDYCDRMELQREPTLRLWRAMVAFYDAFEAQGPTFQGRLTEVRAKDQLPADRPFEAVGPHELAQILLRLLISAYSKLRSGYAWMILTDQAEAALADLKKAFEAALLALKEARVAVEAARE